jgi:phosphotransferase system HPr (HPr) family protein
MSGSSRREVVITNGAGLHLRAAGRLVQLARQFRSEVRVFCEGRVADCGSVLDLLMLGAGCGARLEIEVSGADAEEAAVAICGLIETRFDEQQEFGLAC